MLWLCVTAAIVAGIYSLAGFYGVPWLIERGFDRYAASSPGRAASASAIRFEPFSLRGEIAGAELLDAESGTAVSAATIMVDFDIRSLTERRPVIRSIAVGTPNIEVTSATALAAFAQLLGESLGRTSFERLAISGGTLSVAGGDGEPLRLSELELRVTAFDALSSDDASFSLSAETGGNASASIDGSVTTSLATARGRLVLNAMSLESLPARIGDDIGDGIGDTALSGYASLSGPFTADLAADAATLAIADASLDLEGVSLTLASGLDVTVDPLRAEGVSANLRSATGRARLAGRIEASESRVAIRDNRLSPARTYVLDDAAVVAAADDSGLSVILGGVLPDAGPVAVTVRAPPAPAPRNVSIEASDLPAAVLSPYAVESLRRSLTAGRADFGLEYSVTDGRADGILRLSLRNLGLGPRTDDGATRSADAELAVALLEDAAGVIDLDLAFTSNAGEVRAAVDDALVARINAVTATPFATLASLTLGGGQPNQAVPFLPGEAALGDAALASVEALAGALNGRPRLAIRVHSAFDPTADRNALARQQIELHVALATAGAGLQARAAPVDFGSPRTQDVLDEFAAERLPEPQVETLASSLLCDGVLADVCRRVYYQQIFEALVANEAIAETTLNRLGRFRAQSVADTLRQGGVAEERIEIVPGNSSVETAFGIGLPIEVTAFEPGRDDAPAEESDGGRPEPLEEQGSSRPAPAEELDVSRPVQAAEQENSLPPPASDNQ